MNVLYPIMLRLPESTNLVFHALILLWRSPQGSIGIKALSHSLGGSPSYLAKLFQKLARVGLVTSLRGRGGGYSLSHPAEDITLWDVIRALHSGMGDREASPSQCPVCLQVDGCPCQKSLGRANEEVTRIFRQMTVAGASTLMGEVPSEAVR